MTDSAGIYGKALYDLAIGENLTEELLPQMEMVQKLFEENPDYIRLLLEPSVKKNERLSLLDKAFQGQIHLYLLNFLKLLTEKGLLRSYNGCYRKFRALYNKDHGITDAVVTSAVALDKEQTAKLHAKLEEITGKKVLLSEKVDPKVLGGLRVEIDGQLLDGTVKGRLADIRKAVNNTVL